MASALLESLARLLAERDALIEDVGQLIKVLQAEHDAAVARVVQLEAERIERADHYFEAGYWQGYDECTRWLSAQGETELAKRLRDYMRENKIEQPKVKGK